jgi:hypothetical protein
MSVSAMSLFRQRCRSVNPTILDLPAPHLLGYSRETAVAEKFEAMVKLGELNSRMKDFFDIFYRVPSISTVRDCVKRLRRLLSDVNAELNCHFFGDADVPRLTNSLFLAPRTIAGYSGETKPSLRRMI